MECLIRGCNFLLRNISNEVFEFHREQNPPYFFQDLHHSELFPYLLVNIGSGVSIVKVECWFFLFQVWFFSSKCDFQQHIPTCRTLDKRALTYGLLSSEMYSMQHFAMVLFKFHLE